MRAKALGSNDYDNDEKKINHTDAYYFLLVAWRPRRVFDRTVQYKVSSLTRPHKYPGQCVSINGSLNRYSLDCRHERDVPSNQGMQVVCTWEKCISGQGITRPPIHPSIST